MLLAVPANEIIIGGLSHSSSTAVAVGMVVRWCAVAVRRWCGGGAAVGVVFPPLGDRRRPRAREKGGALLRKSRARDGARARGCESFPPARARARSLARGREGEGCETSARGMKEEEEEEGRRRRWRRRVRRREGGGF